MDSKLIDDNFLIYSTQMILEGMEKINLNMNKIVFVISKEDQKLVGTLSDGDIRRYLLRKGNINDLVFNACNKKPIFIRENNCF